MDTPYVDELLRRMRLDSPDARRTPGGIGWTPAGFTDPIELRVADGDLAAAVNAIGRACRDDLWPDATVDEAGFNLLLVHLDEVLATRVVDSFVVIGRGGVVWPTERRLLS